MKLSNFMLLVGLCIFVTHSIANDKNEVFLATTTTTDNSGLLSYLLPIFERQHNIKVRFISSGTGRALKIAENGDVDVVMVHDPIKEKQFIVNGDGILRKYIMHNSFLIVGDKKDLAGISSSENISEVFRKIAKAKVTFISRADDSGTHTKELELWRKSLINPKGSWYKQVGQGMGKSLQIADELRAYILVDSGTWLKLKDKISLTLLYYGDSVLFNPYSTILVNPDKYPRLNHEGAKKFVAWLHSKNTKKLINGYKINNQQLFFTH